jgi:hypothetical protein
VGPESEYSVDAAARSGAAIAAARGYGGESFYPLHDGNRWEYAGRLTTGMLASDGSVSEDDWPITYTESHQIAGIEEQNGRSYSVRQEIRRSHSEFGDDESIFRSFVRQDRTGLFAADALLGDPNGTGLATATGSAGVAGHAAPAALGHTVRASLRRRGATAATVERFARRVERAETSVRGYPQPHPGDGGASQTEVTWLLYPVHTGQSWDLRPDFPWPARVAGIEPLDTPSGRVVAYRIETDPFGGTVDEREWIRLFYGRSGYLGYSLHLQEQGLDEDGNPTGITYVFDDEMLLTSANLADR